MPKDNKSIFECQHCGAQYPKWSGRCSECGQWGTILENAPKAPGEPAAAKAAAVIDLADLKAGVAARLLTGIQEVDRLLGGGLFPGSVVLLSGEPGIGKSTLVAQIARGLGTRPVVYASGEESAIQVKDRLVRLSALGSALRFIGDNHAENIIAACRALRPDLVIVDSVQTMKSNLAAGEPGGLAQIRSVAAQFLEYAKSSGTAVILVGHVTKDGLAAGPKSLEHLVDAVIYLEAELKSGYRILRAVKNRFGSVNEIGVFLMEESGLKEVTDPAGIFLEKPAAADPGSAIGSFIEGSRPFFVEVQALTTKTVFGYPVRKASGFDLNRLQILAAVMSKRTKMNLNALDLIINIAGGFKATDPALDLAVCVSAASSFLNLPLPADTLFFGEVGLSGEVRPVVRPLERLKEASRLGFKRALVPPGTKDKTLQTIEIKSLVMAIDWLAKG